jgi:hypothetical protein
MTTSRILWFVTGCVWAARSVLEFANPDYWDPVSALDWTAVWAFSAALLLLAPSVLLLGRLAPSSKVMITATIVALGALVAGLANGIEDGLGVEQLGTAYIFGFLVLWPGLAVLAVMFGIDGRARLVLLVGALVVGIALLTVGGGLIVLCAFGGVAAAPRWFQSVPSTSVTDSSGGAAGA